MVERTRTAAPAPAPETERFVDSTVGVVAAVLALTVGTWTLNVVGWAVAMLLLWGSRRWSRADKVVGTAVWPTFLLVLLLAPAFGALGAWHSLIVVGMLLPAAVGVWLLVRGLRGVAAAPRRDVTGAVRDGIRGLVDRMPGAVTVAGMPIAAYAVTFAVPVLSPTAMAILAIAGIVLGAGVLVALWDSTAWTRATKTAATATLVGFGVAVAAASGIAAAAANDSQLCVGGECRPVEVLGPAVWTTALLQLGLPLLILHVLVTMIGWRPERRLTPRRFGAAGITALVIVGGVGFALMLVARHGVGSVLPVALAALALWTAGIVLLWRADGWTGLDRAAGTFVIPALLAVPLFLPLAIGVGRCADGNPLLPGALGGPDESLAVGVFAVVEVLLALWLLVRFEPSASAPA